MNFSDNLLLNFPSQLLFFSPAVRLFIVNLCTIYEWNRNKWIAFCDSNDFYSVSVLYVDGRGHDLNRYEDQHSATVRVYGDWWLLCLFSINAHCILSFSGRKIDFPFPSSFLTILLRAAAQRFRIVLLFWFLVLCNAILYIYTWTEDRMESALKCPIIIICMQVKPTSSWETSFTEGQPIPFSFDLYINNEIIFHRSVSQQFCHCEIHWIPKIIII